MTKAGFLEVPLRPLCTFARSEGTLAVYGLLSKGQAIFKVLPYCFTHKRPYRISLGWNGSLLHIAQYATSLITDLYNAPSSVRSRSCPAPSPLLTMPSTLASIPPSYRPVPTRRVSRPGIKLELPLQPSVAAALPLAFADPQAYLLIAASELASAAFCNSLSPHLRAALSSAVSLFLSQSLRSPQTSTWLSGLAAQWTPAAIGRFSPSSQKRLAARGLLTFTGPVSVTDLAPSCVSSARDLAALLTLLPQHSAVEPPPSHTITIAASSRTPVSSTRTTPTTPPPKWRPSVLSHWSVNHPVAGDIHHDDARFSWHLERLARSLPAATLAGGTVTWSTLVRTAGNSPQSPALQAIRSLDDALTSAARLTVEDELAAIAASVSRATRDTHRTAMQIRMRFGFDGASRSLDDIASAYDLTRQTISKQVILCKALCPSHTHAPKLRSLVASVDAHAGRPLVVLESLFRDLLGPSQSLDGALDFAGEFLGLWPSNPIYRSSPRSYTPASKFVGHACAARSHLVLKSLLQLGRKYGLFSSEVALASASSSSSTQINLQDLHDAIATSPQFIFLDRAHEWIFWSHPRNPLASAIRNATEVDNNVSAVPQPLVPVVEFRSEQGSTNTAPSDDVLRAVAPLLASISSSTSQRQPTQIPAHF